MGEMSLVICHWSLVICHWSFVIGHLSFVLGHWSLGWIVVRSNDFSRSPRNAAITKDK